MSVPDFARIPANIGEISLSGDHGAEISAKLGRIIELLEVQVGALITAQEEADQPEEVDRGYLDG